MEKFPDSESLGNVLTCTLLIFQNITTPCSLISSRLSTVPSLRLHTAATSAVLSGKVIQQNMWNITSPKTSGYSYNTFRYSIISVITLYPPPIWAEKRNLNIVCETVTCLYQNPVLKYESKISQTQFYKSRVNQHVSYPVENKLYGYSLQIIHKSRSHKSDLPLIKGKSRSIHPVTNIK